MDNQEKFLKYTSEILTQTMNDLHMQVIQYKANARILEEIILEQNQKLVEYDKALVEERNQRIAVSTEHAKLAKMQDEFEASKHQLSHLQTFKNELAASRMDCDNLRSEMSILRTKYEENLRLFEDKTTELEQSYSDIKELQNSLSVSIEEQEKLKAKIAELTAPPPEPVAETIVKVKPRKKTTPVDFLMANNSGNDF